MFLHNHLLEYTRYSWAIPGVIQVIFSPGLKLEHLPLIAEAMKKWIFKLIQKGKPDFVLDVFGTKVPHPDPAFQDMFEIAWYVLWHFL